MKNNVIWKVLSSGLRFKTLVLLHRSHIYNEYISEFTIIKLMTFFFLYLDISIKTPHTQVSNVLLLTTSKLIWRHLVINGWRCYCFWHCYCFWYCVIPNIYSSSHCCSPERLRIVHTLYYCVGIINDDPVWSLPNAILLRYRRSHENWFVAPQCSLMYKVIVCEFAAISMDYG